MKCLMQQCFLLTLLLVQHVQQGQCQVPCGPNFCSVGQYCCNESCGTCVEVEGVCTLQYCGDTSFALCFSGESTVQTQTRGRVAMKDVHVGDRILTTSDGFQKVYAFSHHDHTTPASFLQIHTDEMKEPLEGSAKHLVYVEDKTGEKAAPLAAEDIQVGDILQAKGQSSGARVVEIQVVQRTGMYAPFTTDGTLVVDGIVASSYVSLEEFESNPWLQNKIAPISHLAISPFRFWCTKVSDKGFSQYNKDGISQYPAALLSLFQWAVGRQSSWFQGLLLGGYLVLCFVTHLAECMTSVVGLLALVVGYKLITYHSGRTSLSINALTAKKNVGLPEE